MIRVEEVNGCLYTLVNSDYYFWEISLRARVTKSVERVMFSICLGVVAHTFSRLSSLKE